MRLWSATGEPLATLSGHSNSVWSVTFNSDGRTLASASDDGTVRLWNLNGENLEGLGCIWLKDYWTARDSEDYWRERESELNAFELCQPYLRAEDGHQLARQGKEQEAITIYRDIQRSHPDLDLNPRTLAVDTDPEVVARHFATLAHRDGAWQGNTNSQQKLQH